jgi:quinol monooxygenase YgiN
MIAEIAQISVKPGQENEFEAGVAKAVPVFLCAKGCHGVRLEHVPPRLNRGGSREAKNRRVCRH